MQALELKIPPLLLVAVFGLAMFGAARGLPALEVVVPGGLVVAVAVAAVGAITAAAGVVAFRRQRTTVNPTTPGATSSVVSSGVYRWSRNPMYLGFLLLLAGWAVYLSNAAALALMLAFAAYIQQFQIKPEERILLAKFGPEFGLGLPPATAAAASVSTLIGTGAPGFSDQQVNNPYGLAIGPDRALYFCDLDNQRIRRLDLQTKRTSTVAGNGQKAYAGDGGPAASASLNMPHEITFDAAGNLYIAERDNHVIRRVEAASGTLTTFAGTGTPGFSGDGGPASRAQLRQPHSIAVDPSPRRPTARHWRARR